MDEAGRVLNLTWQARLCHNHRSFIELDETLAPRTLLDIKIWQFKFRKIDAEYVCLRIAD